MVVNSIDRSLEGKPQLEITVYHSMALGLGIPDDARLRSQLRNPPPLLCSSRKSVIRSRHHLIVNSDPGDKKLNGGSRIQTSLWRTYAEAQRRDTGMPNPGERPFELGDKRCKADRGVYQS